MRTLRATTSLLRKIGILYQSGALFGSMTLAENVALPILEYTDLSSDLVSDLVRMKLNLVQLEGYEDYLPSEISGGMKKRAGLARAMALNPKILFFDEPSAGLGSGDLGRAGPSYPALEQKPGNHHGHRHP